MATQGPMTFFDRTIKKLNDGTLNLSSQQINAILLSSSQAIARSFLGTSGEAKYADLTGEIATGSGYTLAGQALSSVAFTRPSSGAGAFSSASISWTLTGSITFKYMALYVQGSANQELLMFCDMDTGGGSVTALAGNLQFNPDPTNGWGYWSQP